MIVGFRRAADILREIVRQHEPAILEWPEAYADPAGHWGVLDDDMAAESH